MARMFPGAGVSRARGIGGHQGAEGMAPRFEKSFTAQDPLPPAAIDAVVDLLRAGRLHRYDVAPGAESPVAVLERAFARWSGRAYCLALASGGQALQIALRAAGVTHGDRVLTNGFTLAPVPGAIAATGAEAVLVEVGDDLRPDLGDLAAKAAASGARVLVLSHMRGHMPDMDQVTALCDRLGVALIEDAAHTMGATWNGRPSGSFGLAGCFSTQSYKHLNSGEGGLLVSDDPGFAARATILSGSYMNYALHGAGPAPEAFDAARYAMPNCSARMDALRATLLIPQLEALPGRIARWQALHAAAARAFGAIAGLRIPGPLPGERPVGASLQFLVPAAWDAVDCQRFRAGCRARGVDLAWFGEAEPRGFTSRYDSWRYLAPQDLPRTRATLARLFDLRLPLTFTEADCSLLARIVAEEAAVPARPATAATGA